MTEILIISTGVPRAPADFTEAVARMHAHGVRVAVAVGCPVDKVTVAQGTAEVFQLPDPASLSADDRSAHRKAGKGRKLWLRARRDRQVRRLAGSADVIVALDPGAAITVRELARRHRADAVSDLPSAFAALAERGAHPTRYATRRVLRRAPNPAVAVDGAREWAGRSTRKVARRVLSTVLRNPLGRRVGQAVLTAPGFSDARRRDLGLRMATKLRSLGLPTEATATRLVAAERMRDPADRAEWLMAAVKDELAAGRIPPFLTEATAAELAIADQALSGMDFDAATRSVDQVMQLLFHRAVHFDWLTSLMAPDPTGYLAPLHRSLAGRTMAAPRGRLTMASPPPTDRPHRLLFVSSRDNENFLGDIRARYQQNADFEVRTLYMQAEPEWRAMARVPFLLKHKMGGDPEYGEAIQDWLGPHVDWADTIFVEWCHMQAALFTVIDPGTTRIIVRLHLYEAFTMYPHLVDLSRVDDLVFVSEPLRDFTMDVASGLREPGAPRTPVVTNAARLDRYRLPKHADARFTLAQIGLSRIGKDPRWTFAVLRELRRRDERYNLVLIGADLDGTPTPQAAAYYEVYTKESAELEAQGAIRRIGQTDDVPGALTEVGVILSASVRESFHLGVIEGAASGAVPVVRDWPYFAGRAHSARSIFPTEWMVETPREAACRILEHTASEEIWRETGDAAARHALMTWDWSVVQAQYDRLFQQP